MCHKKCNKTIYVLVQFWCWDHYFCKAKWWKKRTFLCPFFGGGEHSFDKNGAHYFLHNFNRTKKLWNHYFSAIFWQKNTNCALLCFLCQYNSFVWIIDWWCLKNALCLQVCEVFVFVLFTLFLILAIFVVFCFWLLFIYLWCCFIHQVSMFWILFLMCLVS